MKYITTILAIATLSITSLGQETNNCTTNTNYGSEIWSTNGNLGTFNASTYLSYGNYTNLCVSYKASYNFSSEIFYYYKAKVERVVDGDTVDLNIDLGFSINHHTRVRLYGINAPEMKNDTNNAGHEAKAYLTQLIDTKDVVIETKKDDTDKYGRYIATIYLDGENINEKMVEDGKAVRHNYE
jgi:micrococcal nuclease